MQIYYQKIHNSKICPTHEAFSSYLFARLLDKFKKTNKKN